MSWGEVGQTAALATAVAAVVSTALVLWFRWVDFQPVRWRLYGVSRRPPRTVPDEAARDDAQFYLEFVLANAGSAPAFNVTLEAHGCDLQFAPSEASTKRDPQPTGPAGRQLDAERPAFASEHAEIVVVYVRPSQLERAVFVLCWDGRTRWRGMHRRAKAYAVARLQEISAETQDAMALFDPPFEGTPTRKQLRALARDRRKETSKKEVSAYMKARPE